MMMPEEEEEVNGQFHSTVRAMKCRHLSILVALISRVRAEDNAVVAEEEDQRESKQLWPFLPPPGYAFSPFSSILTFALQIAFGTNGASSGDAASHVFYH